MSISVNHVFRRIPTGLEINGPVLSFVSQPTSVSVCDGGDATFTGFATATFPVQTPPNPAENTGSISYRWYIDGVGALSDGNNASLGATVVGSATTVLSLQGLPSPLANGAKVFLRADYIPSAYGVGKSTPNAVNDPLDSSLVGITVFPSITITQQPSDASVAQTRTATFDTAATLTDTSQGSLSYKWQLNGSDLTDSGTVSGSSTPNLSISLPNVSSNTVRAKITHPTSCDSPIFTNSANFTVVAARQIIRFENYYSSSNAGITDKNLFDGQVIIGQDIPRSLLGLYASERDVDVEMELHGSWGSSSGSNRGGIGGYSKIRFTMRQNEEYVIAGLGAFTGQSAFLYRKSRLIANVGNGGYASSSGRGGDGGGVGIAGERGLGRGGGDGGELIATGTLSSSGGIFGSLSPITPTNGNDSKASVPFGGRALACPRGNQTVSPCTDLGTTAFLWGQSTPVPGTGVIDRGFKQGYGIRQTPGAGSGGGNGGGGTTGGDGGTSGGGGGGGGGYTDGSVTVVETQLGGSQYSTAVVILRAVI